LWGFFRANVGNSADESFNQNFNPRYTLPNLVSSVTRVDRGYTPSPNSTVTTTFDDFDAAVSTFCASPNQCGSNVEALKEMVPEHDPALAAASITWTSSGSNQYFQSTWKIPNSYLDVSDFQTLDFRVSRQRSVLNPAVATTFSIQLVMSDGSLSSSVPLCKYFAHLRGPVGGSRLINNTLEERYHRILETVRIPVSDFTGADLTHIRAVRFIFDGTPQGAVYLANIRFAK